MAPAAAESGPCDEYIYQSSIPPFKFPQNITLPQFVLEAAECYSDRIAIVDSSDERKYTYGQVQTLVKNVTAGLVELGIKKGDVVCIVLPNMAEYFLLVFGIMSAGGVFSGVNPYAHPKEIAKQVSDSEAKLIITDPAALVKMTEIDVPKAILGEAPKGTISVEQTLFQADGSKAPSVDISPDDLCALPYSSGTTGMSKGVMITHRNLVCNLCQTLCQVEGKFSHEQVAQDGGRTVLGLMPMFHIYGISGLGCATMRMKGTVVVMERYEIRRFLEMLIKYEVTFAPLVPPIILQLVKSPIVDEFDLSKLKLQAIMCAAAPLSPELQKAFETKFPDVYILQAYGLTEYSCITISHVEVYQREPAKKGSVGYLLPGTQVKFVDLSTGNSVPRNTLGELYAKGPMVMKGYHKNPEATKATVDDEGWLHTGDVGYIDDDGDVFIVDRVKELIKYKGFQVPPAELEALLIAHPAINDAAVVGIPDEEAGEIPAASIVLKPNALITEREIKAYIADQVANYKKLRIVQLVSSIPKSSSGKILRRVVKDQILQTLQAWEQIAQAVAK
ncbi:unnamed protein product [Calypogeia fissa]